jgi:hypothetical protein
VIRSDSLEWFVVEVFDLADDPWFDGGDSRLTGSIERADVLSKRAAQARCEQWLARNPGITKARVLRVEQAWEQVGEVFERAPSASEASS